MEEMEYYKKRPICYIVADGTFCTVWGLVVESLLQIV